MKAILTKYKRALKIAIASGLTISSIAFLKFALAFKKISFASILWYAVKSKVGLLCGSVVAASSMGLSHLLNVVTLSTGSNALVALSFAASQKIAYIYFFSIFNFVLASTYLIANTGVFIAEIMKVTHTILSMQAAMPIIASLAIAVSILLLIKSLKLAKPDSQSTA